MRRSWTDRLDQWVWSGGAPFAILALTQPVATVGAALGAAWLDAYGPRTWAARGVFWGLALATGLLWLSSISFTGFDLAGGASLFVLLFAVSLTPEVVTTRALAQHGETVTCTVLDVDERRETTAHHHDDGISWSTTYYYDHAVQCPAAYPDEVTTQGDRGAEAGERKVVTYDPRRHVDARFGPVGMPQGLRAWAPAILLGACIVLRAVSLLLDDP